MNILQSIIGLMSKEEIRHYKIFANRTSSEKERMDIKLFDFIRKSFPEYDEKIIFKRLYNSHEKNSFYRLKNRLAEDLGKSLLLQHHGSGEMNLLLNNLLLAHLFRNKGQAKIAFHYLSRAEKKASAMENFELLEMIYSAFIRLSHETLEINPEEYIQKRKKNRVKLSALQEIDDVLAAVIYRVKTSQNFSKQNAEILQLLQKTINDFSKSKEIKQSPQLRFKIYHSVSRLLLQQHDYVSLEKYLLKTFNEFSKEKLFDKNNHDTKLQMLTYLSNSLFKNKKYDLSLAYAEKLKKTMNEFNGFLHDKYLFYYYSALVYNYSEKDLDKAVEILNEAKENEVIKKLPDYMVFVHLNLAVVYYEKGEFRTALKNSIKLTLQEEFNKLDIAFRIKIIFAELIIRYEVGNFDFLETKLVQVKKEFVKELKSADFHREREIIEIMGEMMVSQSIRRDKKLVKKIQKLVEGTEKTDSDIIDYSEWLNSKIKK